jgi:hypothetical protein
MYVDALGATDVTGAKLGGGGWTRRSTDMPVEDAELWFTHERLICPGTVEVATKDIKGFT